MRWGKETPIHNYYKKACSNHCKNQQKRKKTFLENVNEKFKKEQPIIDIQQQLKKLPPINIKIVFKRDYAFIEQSRIMKALFTLATLSMKKIVCMMGRSNQYLDSLL